MTALNSKQIDEIRSVIAALDALQTEIVAAVKRKGTEPVSSFQLKLINGVLARANALFKSNLPVTGFTTFDPDEIPTASDVGMVVSQYVEAMEKIRCEHITRAYNGTWYWVGNSSIHTVPPRGRK